MSCPAEAVTFTRSGGFVTIIPSDKNSVKRPSAQRPPVLGEKKDV